MVAKKVGLKVARKVANWVGERGVKTAVWKDMSLVAQKAEWTVAY